MVCAGCTPHAVAERKLDSFRAQKSRSDPNGRDWGGIEFEGMELAVETSGLTRDFGSFRAVDGIDLAVPAGSLYGFLGPNGAGKSTTIKCLTGLLGPTAGTMRILGTDPLVDPVGVK